MKALGIYIHIPFCKRKCNYCDFYSRSCCTNISDYVCALCAHIRKEASLYDDCLVDSVFIGGGTPSLLCEADIDKLFDVIKSSFSLAENAEISVEGNPESLSAERLAAFKKNGVNRLSMGLQSCVEPELVALGRIHTLADFESAYSDARKAGFDNINIDIMYALPEQSVESFKKTLDYVTGLDPEHISCYCLKIEDGTPFSKMSLSLPDEDAQYSMYMTACQALECAGYKQYEISNFSKNGRRCVHNLKYWQSDEYVGFGPSAHSFFDGVRYFYEDETDKYVDEASRYGSPQKIAEEDAKLTPEEKMDEYVMLRLRLSDGVDTTLFKELFGVEFESLYDVQGFVDDGYMIKRNGCLSFSPKGFFVSNFILSQILKAI